MPPRRSSLLALGAALALPACALLIPSRDVGDTCRFAGDTSSTCGRCVAALCITELDTCCLDPACASVLSDLEACTGGACVPLGVDERAPGTAGALALCVARACAPSCGGADGGLDLDAAGVVDGDGRGEASADASGEGGGGPDAATDSGAADAGKSDASSDGGGTVRYCSVNVDVCSCRTSPFDASAAGQACNGATFGGTPSQVSCCATPDWPASGKCSCVPMACTGISSTLCSCVIAPLDAGDQPTCTGTCCVDNQNGDTCACAPN